MVSKGEKQWRIDILLIVNVSTTTGVFHSAFKNALVYPILKKTSLDQNELHNYRPVSKLSFVSKIAEKVVAARFSNHLSDNGLYEQMQSAYCPHHRTETALIRVCNDMLCSLDERKAVILVLLDNVSGIPHNRSQTNSLTPQGPFRN